MNEAVPRARELVRAARSLVVLTGAGVSAESGVPTFRGAGGQWKSYRPEELATPEAFARDPRTVWEWYAWRRSLVAACSPNAAHRALAGLALGRDGHVTLVTQNVDGLHRRAAEEIARERGVDPAPALPFELHGAIHRDRCSGCGRRTPARTDVDVSGPETLPHCTECGALLRPDVIWFGEPLDSALLGDALDAAERADVCLVVGTSAVVHPAAGLPAATLASGGAVIEVNPEPTPLSPRAELTLRGAAGEVVPLLVG